MKYLKKIESAPFWRKNQISMVNNRKYAFKEYKKEYQKYFNKYVIIKFKKTGRLDMYKVLNNIDILEVYDNLEEVKYNFNLMTTANKYNI